MRLFICFAAEDRYSIAEPIVYHLKNYGIEAWYDRYALVMADNRKQKNLEEGASKCTYAITILSKHTAGSICAMEELSIIEDRYYRNEVAVFPILFEISPGEIPCRLQWIKEIIFKEVDRHSGTREICNHIACKITSDYLENCNYKRLQDVLCIPPSSLPPVTHEILNSYRGVDCANLNSRVALLYTTYLIFSHSQSMQKNSITDMISSIFKRLFSETRLNLDIDYRELWLLENSICILVNCYLASCKESKI